MTFNGGLRRHGEREPEPEASFTFFSYFRDTFPSAIPIRASAVVSKLFIILSISLSPDSLRPSGFLPADDILSASTKGEENGSTLFSARKSHVRVGRILSSFSKKGWRMDGRPNGRTSEESIGRRGSSRSSRGPGISLSCGALTSRQGYSSFEVIPR